MLWGQTDILWQHFVKMSMRFWMRICVWNIDTVLIVHNQLILWYWNIRVDMTVSGKQETLLVLAKFTFKGDISCIFFQVCVYIVEYLCMNYCLKTSYLSYTGLYAAPQFSSCLKQAVLDSVPLRPPSFSHCLLKV